MTTKERNELIVDNISFADRIASIQFKKTPRCVQLDEIKSAAYMGLVDAASKYDGLKPFKNYAQFRIFGEIKDYLRSLYWFGREKVESLPKEIVCKNDHLNETFEDLTVHLSSYDRKIVYMYFIQDNTMQEIADSMQISLTKVYNILNSSIQEMQYD